MQLLTAKQVAERYGLPSPHTVRTMMTHDLPFRRFGRPYLFHPAEVEEFIASKKEVMWRDETEVRISASSPTAGCFTSSGASTASPAARARARTTAEQLKRHSRGSSQSADGSDRTGAALATLPISRSQKR
jgi:excisionase family DNA binding protein